MDNYDDFYSHHLFQPLREDDFFRAHRVIPRVGWALDIAKEINPESVLDLGCLDGSLLLTLCTQIRTIRGFGVDLSVEGTDIATDRAIRHHLNAEFLQGSIEDYLESCADDAYDMITMFELIEHVKDPDWCIEQIHRVLKPGGTLLVSTPAFESPQFGMDDEQNKCHIRLYTRQPENYTAVNKYGHEREATSIIKQLKDFNMVSNDMFAHLIHARVTK
jgi:2-polyprenyl-3-methyl-5-hydroxy-6-metoxy-1,4-benzoquinol methylase